MGAHTHCVLWSDYRFLEFAPSTIAASAVVTARAALHMDPVCPPCLPVLSAVTHTDMQPCINLLTKYASLHVCMCVYVSAFMTDVLMIDEHVAVSALIGCVL